MKTAYEIWNEGSRESSNHDGMKQLIEKYKERLENIEQFLNGTDAKESNLVIVRTKERALMYRTFIAELEALMQDEKEMDCRNNAN